MSGPVASDPAGTVIIALPPARVVAAEAYPPPLRTTEPVGAEPPLPPAKVMVTNNDCVVVMLEGDGDTVTVGVTSAAATVKVSVFDVPPPGVGLNTVTGKGPALATSVARMLAVTWLALTYVVMRALPLKLTTELLMNSDPLTVSVKAPEPAVALEGLSIVIAGTGLFVPAALIVKFTGVEIVPPPGAGSVTVTAAVPAFVMALAGIAAVSCAAFTKVVGSASQAKLTTESPAKFAPSTVSVNAPDPAVALGGSRLPIAGPGPLAPPGATTVNTCAAI